MDPKNIFRNPMGRRYLRALFFEEVGEDKSTVVYTLKREDHLGYPSLYRLYMETADPTEYQFALRHLDGWSHWKELSAAEWFKPFIDEWRHELEVMLRSKALSAVLTVADDKSNNRSYNANKYLLEGGWKPVEKSKRGRPSKDEVQREIIAQAGLEREIEKDAERLNLKGIN